MSIPFNRNGHIMVDLETMGLDPGAPVVSIGAVYFTQAKGIVEDFEALIDLSSCMEYGLEPTADTIQFWLAQPDEARQKLLQKPRVDLIQALYLFNEFYGAVCEQHTSGEVTIWGNGATFDNVILEEAYRTTGVPIHWPFYIHRCFRTIKSSFPIDYTPSPEHIPHDAVSDAREQVLHLMQICKEYNLTIL